MTPRHHQPDSFSGRLLERLSGYHSERMPARIAAARARRGPDRQSKRTATHQTVPKRPKTVRTPPSASFTAMSVIVAGLTVLGLVMVLSATALKQAGSGTSPYGTFQKQVMLAAVGAAIGYIILRFDYSKLRNGTLPIVVAASIAMILPFTPWFGVTVNGANSWARIGPVSFQPSEALKLAVVVFLADFYTRHQHDVHLTRYGAKPLAAAVAATAGICFAQGDLGSAIVLAGIVLSVGVIARVPVRHIATITMTGAAAVAAAVMSDPRRVARFTAFRDIEGNREDIAFQSWQGLLSIANGGLTGSGIGQSTSKLGYLPLAHSDFIFAVVADELGFIGAASVLGAFGLLIIFGAHTAAAATTTFGTLLAGGITMWIGLQTLINVGGVVGVLPVTGITLPFFSAGGTSLMVSIVAASLLLNVSRHTPAQPTAHRLRRRTLINAPT